ncbi:MAG: FHA domain-containing protein [Anaerolineales bacterium]|nr:FHA domain-containing protein [Anaerolineales bacterium]
MSGPIVLALRILLTLSLISLLGWMYYSIWQNVRQQGEILASRKVPGINIEIRQKDSLPIARLFTQPEIVIGREPNSDILLTEETASARHARLNYHHSQWWLEDLDSKNGTILNSNKLTTPTVIISNDEIICGKTTLTIRLQSDSSVTTTQRI